MHRRWCPALIRLRVSGMLWANSGGVNALKALTRLLEQGLQQAQAAEQQGGALGGEMTPPPGVG